MNEKNTPIFVKIEEYKDVIDIIKVLKQKIRETKETINQINKLKNEEDAEIELWTKNLEDATSNIDYIDSLLFEPKF